MRHQRLFMRMQPAVTGRTMERCHLLHVPPAKTSRVSCSRTTPAVTSPYVIIISRCVHVWWKCMAVLFALYVDSMAIFPWVQSRNFTEYFRRRSIYTYTYIYFILISMSYYFCFMSFWMQASILNIISISFIWNFTRFFNHRKHIQIS